MNEMARPARAKWKAHWTLVFSAMAGMSFYTVITYSLGTFIEPLEQEFGWGRAELSVGLTIFAVISMVGGPLIGEAIGRLGTRRIALVLACSLFVEFGPSHKFAQIQPPGSKPAPA